MRVLAMVHLWPPRHCAGAELMLESMLRPLAERGHSIDVLLSRSTPDAGPYQRNGIIVHPRVDRDDPWRLMPTADVVVTHLENTARAMVLGAKLGKPVIQVIHNTHPTTKTFLTRSTALAVFNSQWMADDFGFDGPQVIIRPPVFPDEYRTTPGDAVTLVNLNEDKGAHVFYALAERLPDAPFLGVVGAYGKQIIRDLSNVTILEHGQEMRAVYSRTRLLLMPSLYESWGRVGVEAMCSGIPVIAHPTPGLVESLGAAGTFCDRADLDGWEQAVRRLLGRPWGVASRKASARAAELDPSQDITRWCEAVEALGGVRRAA